MNYFYLWLFLLFALAVAVFSVYLLLKLKKESKQSDYYLQALESILSGNTRQAIEKLKKTVKANSENIEAYIKLGNLLREQGLAKNAIRIHSDLTFRSSATKEQKKAVLNALFEDYVVAGDWEQAAVTGRKLSALDKSVTVINKFLSALEKTEKWDEAIKVAENYGRSSKELKNKLALYKVMKGIKVADESDGHNARLVFKEALKVDNSCIAAYYYIGLSYYLEERFEDALEFWKKLAQKVPDKSHTVFNQIEKTYYDMGQFPKVETFYKELMSQYPGSFPPVAATAMLMSKKGSWNDAFKILEKYIANNPDKQKEAQRILFKISLTAKNSEKALSAAEYLLAGGENTIFDRFQCRSCGYTSEEPEWLCPKCKALNSFMD